MNLLEQCSEKVTVQRDVRTSQFLIASSRPWRRSRSKRLNSTLVRHFGDSEDGKTRCGLCDFCAPAACIAQRYRTATDQERATLFRVLAALRSRGPKATGRLYSDLFPAADMSRDNFEDILGAMARAGLLLQVDEVFERDGKRIPYRTVRLTPQGHAINESSPIVFVMKDASSSARKRGAKKQKARSTTKGDRRKQPKAGAEVIQQPVSKRPPAGLEEALRTWRLQEAKRRSLPAFRIFNDRVLKSILDDLPRSSNQLSGISGIGSSLIKQYGNQICHVVNQHSPSTTVL